MDARPKEIGRPRAVNITAFFHPSNPKKASGILPRWRDIFGSRSPIGADADDGRIEFLLSEVKGKDITELIASGREKFASVPSGGGAVAVAAPVGSGGGGAVTAAAAEPKKEEKVEEKEESDDDMGFSLFD
ncbi:60S acidic ribosomal protein P2 isoform X1 [Dendrobium catenatum]|uniref:60S acidic ribosomal protein P2 isoform X1 n=1 Tax=Dendrobium catenatum TaxID=906689 RepID=UPI0009F56110|nr:60S acidic ribosomal protein P2 isoform X1 [Dendrobium catenatum]